MAVYSESQEDTLEDSKKNKTREEVSGNEVK